MFEAVRSNRRIVQVILGVIVLTFAFFGIESYLTSIGSDSSVATVGGTKIGPNEFENALRRRQDQIRERAGGQVDLAQLNSPAIRQSVLDGLVNQRLLAIYAAEQHISVPLAQLQQVIASIDSFKDNGQFSRERYVQTLRSQGLSEAAFESQLRQDVAFQQLTTALGSSAVAPRRTVQNLLSLQLEERKVAVASLSASGLAANAEIGDEQIAAYYQANSARFQVPASVKAEFVVLDRGQLARKLAPDAEAVRKWYDEHKDRFTQEEERRVRHILINAAADASETEVGAARARAEKILAELRAAGGKNFEQLARKESQDPGSAEKGGDLGYFARGMMVKPFEDAAFSLEPGRISELVRSDFGFHILEVTGIHASKVKPLDEVRAQVEEELRQQEAQRKFAESAETFTNLAYEQPDSLRPVAEKFGLELQVSDWVTQRGNQSPPFNDPRLTAALFADEAISKKLNTEAFDLGEGRLVAARVLEYRAAETQSLEKVKTQIAAELKREAGAKLAAERGQAALRGLKAGEKVDLKFGEATAMRRRTQGMSPEALRAVFAVDAKALPAYAGASTPDGNFEIYRVEASSVPTIADDDPRLAALRAQYERMLGERDLQAFLAQLRRKYGVEINRTAVQAVAS